MPQKTTKKPAAKKVAKKTSATVAKSTITPKPVMADLPLPETAYCHCTKRKRNMILTCTIITSFAVGFMVSHLFVCDAHHFKHNGPRFQYAENGCLKIESIKCPKMLENLPAIDVNQDGCITKEEMHALKKAAPRPAQVEAASVEFEE